MEQREQHADDYGHAYTQKDGVIDELGDEQTRKQCAEQTEAHGYGEGELFERPSKSPHAVGGYAAAEDDKVGQKAHGYRRVYVRKGRGHAYRLTRDGDHLHAEELEQRSHKYVAACGEYVAAEEAVVLGAVGLCHIVEEADELFDDELELAGHLFKAGNGEDAHARGENEQDYRDDEARKYRGIDAHAEEIEPLFLVHYGVGQLFGKVALLRRADEYRADEQRRQHRDEHGDYDYFFVCRLFYRLHCYLEKNTPDNKIAGRRLTLKKARADMLFRYAREKWRADNISPLRTSAQKSLRSPLLILCPF